MATKDPDRPLSEAERKEVFLALVQAQDAGVSIVRSRKDIAEQFTISDKQLRRIEQEGVDGDWPPLGS
jgi:hypothetical protein